MQLQINQRASNRKGLLLAVCGTGLLVAGCPPSSDDNDDGVPTCGTSVCDVNATCVTSTSTLAMTCVCNSGYTGDGTTCTNGDAGEPGDGGDAGSDIYDGGASALPCLESQSTDGVMVAWGALGIPDAGNYIMTPGPFAGWSTSDTNGFFNQFCAWGGIGICAASFNPGNDWEEEEDAPDAGGFSLGTTYTFGAGDAGTGGFYARICPGSNCQEDFPGSWSGQIQVAESLPSGESMTFPEVVLSFTAQADGGTIYGCIDFQN